MLHEMDDMRGQEPANVDISFLEGPQLTSGSAWPGDTKSDGMVHGSVSRTIRTALNPPEGQPTRSATLRQYGQKLASETKMVVAVKELPPGVDISSLAGLDRPVSFLSESQRHESVTDFSSQSFFYPTDPEQPNWRPSSMRRPYICMLIIVSLVLAAVQEFLYRRSRNLAAQGMGLIQYNSVAEIPTAQFFAWKYLPTIVMVFYGVLYQITDYDVKRLEPYYQLSQPTGSPAAQSLNLDYVTLWVFFVPLKALWYRHWAVLVSSFGSILATTAAPSLQNPSIMPVENPRCQNDPTSCGGEFRYFVRIHPVWSRLVTVCLVLVAGFAAILMVQLRRKSGLLSDPRGVAGIASMAAKSHILTDFQGMDEAREDEIHKKLRHRRYILYKSTIWQGEYMRQNEHDAWAERKPHNPHPIILRGHSLILLMALLSLVLPFIPLITYSRLSIIPHRLPWLPVLAATLIKQLWTTLEFAIKMLEPFYHLSRGNARPEVTLTLDYQGTPYGVLPLRAALNRHYLVALVGVGSILCDILTVTATSLSLTNQTWESFIASSTLSTAIVLLLILSAALVYRTRRHPFLPRQPATIAAILAFVYQSRMLDDFAGTERFSNRQMEEMLVRKGKRYALAWFKGRDNKPHCAVDEEPMLSRYVHGVSYLQAQAPWEESFDPV